VLAARQAALATDQAALAAKQAALAAEQAALAGERAALEAEPPLPSLEGERGTGSAAEDDGERKRGLCWLAAWPGSSASWYVWCWRWAGF
ncbi:MAG TPA: hypothetical protein VJU80_11725, partial [Solirubrobacteraceae bacterium]|nr:hypothetical protein [Solirubrobacteraceae bacterium]